MTWMLSYVNINFWFKSQVINLQDFVHYWFMSQLLRFMNVKSLISICFIHCSNKTITFCSPFPNITNYETYAQYNIAIKSLIYYFIPLTIIAFFYVLMAIRLHHSANEMPGEIRGTQSVAQARARRHVARMVLIFVFCKYPETNSLLYVF